MKKNVLLTLSLVAMGTLAGCGGTGDNTSAPVSTTQESKPSEQVSETSIQEEGYALKNVIQQATTIQIWTTFNDNYQAVINDAIEEFKSIEPNVTIVNVKESADYNGLATKIINGFGADEYPDICAVYPDSVADFINNMKALNIQNYLYDSKIGFTQDDFDDISEGYIKEGQSYVIPGTYSMPLSKSTEVMYYNADALIGLDLKNPNINEGKPLTEAYFADMTWEELFDNLCPAIKAYNDGADAKDKLYDDTDENSAIVGYDSDSNFFITLAEQYGYGYTSVDSLTGQGKLDFNNDGMKALMKKLNGYYKAGYLTTTGTYGTYTSGLSTTNKALFSIGSSAGASNQFSSSLKFDVGVCAIPHAEGKANRVISQGPSMSFLSHNDENRAKAAWLFYRFFSTKEYNTRWAIASNYLPIRYSVYEEASYATYAVIEGKEKNTKEICIARTGAAAKATAPYLYTSPVFKGSSDARTQVGAALTACLKSENIDSEINTIFQTAYDNTMLKM